ncbi:ryanodine receptor 2 isoform X1, partial [Tachysurus ichikawai]
MNDVYLTSRVVMKMTVECRHSALRIFFETAAVDLELAVDSVTPGVIQIRGDGGVLTYTITALLPVLTSVFQHTAHCQSSADLM